MNDTTTDEFGELLQEKFSLPEFDYDKGDLAEGVSILLAHCPGMIDEGKRIVYIKSTRVKAVGSGVITTFIRKRRGHRLIFEKAKERLERAVEARSELTRLKEKIKSGSGGIVHKMLVRVDKETLLPLKVIAANIVQGKATEIDGAHKVDIDSVIELINIRVDFEEILEMIVKGHEVLNGFMETCYEKMEKMMDKCPEIGPPEDQNDEDEDTDDEEEEEADDADDEDGGTEDGDEEDD
ncbi:hypothetical protein TWF696_000256 [Orbilia brochopaga]|uniref:Uncharacterized protein n=1 Tax=Orbilia brochopaga TaxID=3140254 RepID=A0AAV9VD35_9PEZI